jgi:hypothetical protein
MSMPVWDSPGDSGCPSDYYETISQVPQDVLRLMKTYFESEWRPQTGFSWDSYWRFYEKGRGGHWAMFQGAFKNKTVSPRTKPVEPDSVFERAAKMWADPLQHVAALPGSEWR